MMTQLGFVGLGTMGNRAAKRLLDAGYQVIGYNRTKSRAQRLLEAGMSWAETPCQVAEATDILFSMVTDNAALQEITQGQDGILASLRPGKIYIDMSTVSPALSQGLAEQVAQKGAHMLEMPVSGSPVALEQGTASLLVGGHQAIFKQVRPIVQAIAPKVIYVGKNGQALAMKLAINISLPVQFLAFSEGILLAEKAGIPREQAIAIWLDSAVAAPGMKYRGPFAMSLPETPLFDVNMMQKDMVLALELSRESNTPLPSGALANEFLTAARNIGLGEQDFAALFQVLARLAGVDK